MSENLKQEDSPPPPAPPATQQKPQQPEQQQQQQQHQESVSSPPAPAPAPAHQATGVVWTLVPTVVFGDGTSAPAAFSTSFPTSVNGAPVPIQLHTDRTSAQPTITATANDGSSGAAESQTLEGSSQPMTLVQIQTPKQQSFPSQAYLVAPPNFAATLGQNITIALPSHPQARVSNDPNQPLFTLDLTEDTTDLPLPLEDEVDLSTYNYKINLGKDVVSGKGGKVQQLNRHFRNMVAAAYPTYDATSSKISKRKIGLKIYQAIIDRGGRFLDLEGKPMDRPKSILKVMKALKDAKTWTSDAKRLAKRKREDQKKEQAEKEAKKVLGDASVPQVQEETRMITKEESFVDSSATHTDMKVSAEAQSNDGGISQTINNPCLALPTSSLVENSGQVLLSEKQKNALAPMSSDAVNDGGIEFPSIKREEDGTIVWSNQQEGHLAHHAAALLDSAMGPDDAADASLEEAAAVAAAVAAGEMHEYEVAVLQDSMEAPGPDSSSSLGGLQLLTKAAANASGTKRQHGGPTATAPRNV